MYMVHFRYLTKEMSGHPRRHCHNEYPCAWYLKHEEWHVRIQSTHSLYTIQAHKYLLSTALYHF